MSKIVLLTFLIFVAMEACGCTCDPDLKEKDLIRKSEYAFIGVVISNIYKDKWAKEFAEERDWKMDARVRVIKVLKGKILSNEVIVISSQSSECQVNLVPGKRYLITGTVKHNKLDPPESDTVPPFEPDSTIKIEQPDIKDTDEWIIELQRKQHVIFTSICQTRYKR